MRLQRLSVSLFGLIAVVSVLLAGATVWLLLTNPVTVANAVNEGEISPLVRELARRSGEQPAYVTQPYGPHRPGDDGGPVRQSAALHAPARSSGTIGD